MPEIGGMGARPPQARHQEDSHKDDRVTARFADCAWPPRLLQAGFVQQIRSFRFYVPNSRVKFHRCTMDAGVVRGLLFSDLQLLSGSRAKCILD